MPLSLLVIDCDDFKEINDRAGHEFGDALLREVADVLVRALPEGAEAARLGGDEFVVDASRRRRGRGRGARRSDPDACSPTGSRTPASRSGSRPASSTYPFDGATPTSLLRAGDQALYAAKTAGKDRIASFRELTRRRPGRSDRLSATGALEGGGVAEATGPARCSPTP